VIAEATLIAKLVACGLSPSGISVRYEDFLQSDVITFSPAAGVSETKFECIYKAVWGSFVEFDDKVLGSKYAAFEEREAGDWARGEAASWLKAHNKFEGAPTLSPTQDPKVWAGAVEHFCGFQSGEVIEFVEPTFMTLRHSTTTFPPDPKVQCLMYVIWLSDLKASGIVFGFVGNEQYSDGPK